MKENAQQYTELVPFKYGHAKQILVLKNDPHVSESIRLTGEFSPAEVRVFEKFIKPGDTVIDAGALYGEHTLPMAELVGSSGWVYAFEPQRIPFQILCGNVQLNSLLNVIAYCVALGDGASRSTAMCELDPYTPAAWGMARTDQDGKHPLIPRAAIDDVYFQGSKVTFLKLDLEGDEPRALLGAGDLIARFQPVLYIEWQSNRHVILEEIEQHGYRPYLHKAPADPRDTGVPMLLALPPGREVESDWLKQEGFQAV